VALRHPRRRSRRHRVQGGLTDGSLRRSDGGLRRLMTWPHSSEAERDGFAGSGRAVTALSLG
jgi:hypothetical protein